MKLFTIIIPVYNVEKYISNCLNNIYSQGFEEELYEIIVINDGTPDNSMSIVEEFKNKYNNIVIINKENGGVSSARNIGIENAKGKYIIFLDADDFISDGSLKCIKNYVDNKDVDICVLRSIMTSSKKEAYCWTNLFQDAYICDGKEIYTQGYTRASVCGCVFSREFIIKHNIRFYEKTKNGEDTIFFNICQLNAKKIMFINKVFYNVYERENSACRSVSKEKVELMFNSIEYVHQYAIENNITDPIAVDMLQSLKYLLISNMTFFSIWLNEKKMLKYIKEKGINKYLPIEVKTGNLSKGTNKWYIRFMNLSYSLYYYLRLIKYKI